MGEGRTVLDSEYPLPLYLLPFLNEEGRGAIDHDRLRVVLPDALPHLLDPFPVCSIHLVDHDHIGTEEVGSTGIVGEFMPRTMGIGNHDLKIGLEEGKVVVS